MVERRGETTRVRAEGNGPLDAFCKALRAGLGLDFSLHSYLQHDIDRGSASRAVSYIEITAPDGEGWWGVGLDSDIVVSSVKALLSALNRMEGKMNRETA